MIDYARSYEISVAHGVVKHCRASNARTLLKHIFASDMLSRLSRDELHIQRRLDPVGVDDHVLVIACRVPRLVLASHLDVVAPQELGYD